MEKICLKITIHKKWKNIGITINGNLIGDTNGVDDNTILIKLPKTNGTNWSIYTNLTPIMISIYNRKTFTLVSYFVDDD